jgi:hypothetical protein
MGHLQRSTIEGFNSFLTDQQSQPGHCRMSLTMFDTSFDVRYVGEEVHYISPLDTMSYIPGGGTALLDAVGTTIKGAEQWITKHGPGQPIYAMGGSEPKAFYPQWTDWKVLVVIFTDGQENSSRDWHINLPMLKNDDHDIGGLIQWKQNEGWEFQFMGTGGSNWLEKTFGNYVAGDRFYSYAATSSAHTHSYEGLSASTNSLRSTGTYAGVSDSVSNTILTPESKPKRKSKPKP